MESYSITDTGRVREANQDFVYASNIPVGPLPNLFVVADGMGGHNAGDRASSYAVETFLDSIRSSSDQEPVRIIREALEEANASVRRAASSDSGLQGMGTTMVAASVQDQTLYVANVGDSRLYLIDDREIRQITRDHSLVEEMIRIGGITREEGRNHPDKNVITRAIGVADKVRPDFFEMQISEKDTVLMCSDGLSNMVSDEEIREIVNQAEDLETAGRRLVETANKNGGLDNITVLLTKLDEVQKC